MELFLRGTTKQILSYSDWENSFIRLKKSSWKKGRSAQSLAQYWCGDSQDEFFSMIRDHFRCKEIQLNKGYIEGITNFDSTKSNGREHDLLFSKAYSDNDLFTISIEAKVDEEFGKNVAAKYKYAEDRIKKCKATNMISRLDAIYKSITNDIEIKDIHRFEEFKKLRYQLFAGLIGSIAEAKKVNVKKCLMIIHVFKTDSYCEKKGIKNKKDLHRFLEFIGYDKELSSGTILDKPYQLNLNFESDNYSLLCDTGIKLYIGYLESKL